MEPRERQEVQILLQRGLLTETQLVECAWELNRHPSPLSILELLVEKGYVSREYLDALRPTLFSARRGIPSAPTSDAHAASADTVPPGRAVAVRAPEAPRYLGSFELLEELGRGGMGIVYKARDTRLSRVVALKVLGGRAALDDERSKRFRREARAAAKLRHPHIVSVHEVGEELDVCYIAMDYVEGETLAARLHRGIPDVRDVARILKLIAEALDYAHRRGVVHRDVKPENILLDRAGEPFLSDFGLALELGAADDELTSTGSALGTPAFMAPEQARGRHEDEGARTDVYGLGAVLYVALAGRPPFVGSSLQEQLTKILHEEPARPSRLSAGVPRELELICLKCLEKEPARRYASAAELAADLGRFLVGEEIRAHPPGLGVRTLTLLGRQRVRGRLAWLSLVLGATALFGAVAWRARAARELAERRVEAEHAMRDAVERAENGILTLETWGRRKSDREAGEVGFETRRREVEHLLVRARNALPDHADYLVAQARYEVMLGRVAEGLRLLDLVREDDGKKPRAYFYVLGWALLKKYGKGREDPAVHLVHAGSERPAPATVLAVARLPSDTEDQDALARAGQEALTTYLERGPSDVRAWRARLAFAFLGRRFGEVIDLYSNAADEDEQIGYDVEAHWLVTKAIFYVAVETRENATRKAKFQEARRNAESLEQRLAHSPEYWSWRGLIEHGSDDPLAAIRSCDRALELDATYGSAAHNRAFAYHCVGDTRREKGMDPEEAYRTALEGYARSLELNPRLAVAAYDRGLIFQGLADWRRARGLEHESVYRSALADYERTLQLDPLFREAHLGRGMVFEELGDLKAAVAAYETALRLQPDSTVDGKLATVRGKLAKPGR